MKTIFYALGALALASTTVLASDGDGGKMQAERSAVTRGDYAATPRRDDGYRAPSRLDRAGPAATVRLDREVSNGVRANTGPRSDDWMFRSTDRNAVYGD